MKEVRETKPRRIPASVELPPGEVRVLESHHAKDFRMEMGIWAFHKVCWVAVGRGEIEHSGSRIRIQRDDILLLPAGWAHRFVDDPSEPLTLVILCVAEERVSPDRHSEWDRLWRAALGDGSVGAPRCGRTQFHQREIVECFRAALLEQDRQAPGWEIALRNIADNILIRLARQQCVRRESHVQGSAIAVEGALEFIHDHFYEPLRIDDMAERCGLSQRRFTDLFKQRTGMTFSHYINEKRIEFAQERLRESGHILYACHESGFNDPAYFYRVFKKYTGMTPGEFIEGAGVALSPP
jgi:AraC family L-rhamnose operon regulatory protein RhaS